MASARAPSTVTASAQGSTLERALRGVAALNAVFQIAVGALSIASPATAATAFHVSASEATSLALIRMFGGLLASSGVMSAFVAVSPSDNRALVLVSAIGCVINVASDAIVVGTGAMAAKDLAAGVALQVAMVALALPWLRRQRSLAH